MTWGEGPGVGEGAVEGDLHRAGSGWRLTLNWDVSSTPNAMIVSGETGSTYRGFAGTWSYTDPIGDTVGGRITAWRAP